MSMARLKQKNKHKTQVNIPGADMREARLNKYCRRLIKIILAHWELGDRNARRNRVTGYRGTD